MDIGHAHNPQPAVWFPRRPDSDAEVLEAWLDWSSGVDPQVLRVAHRFLTAHREGLHGCRVCHAMPGPERCDVHADDRRPREPQPPRVPVRGWLTTRQVAGICDVTPRTVTDWLRAGHLNGARVRSGRWLVHPTDVRLHLLAAYAKELTR